jgi:hypothetical protein
MIPAQLVPLDLHMYDLWSTSKMEKKITVHNKKRKIEKNKIYIYIGQIDSYRKKKKKKRNLSA